MKGHVKIFGKDFGLDFDFEGPSVKRVQTTRVTVDCSGYINAHESIDLLRLSADQSFSGGIDLGFAAIHAEVQVHLNVGFSWEINVVPHVLSTWIERNGTMGATYEITGGVGEHVDTVLASGKSPDYDEFHKVIFGPLTYRF